MDTAAIRYRVADFLKQHPPFQMMGEQDLRQFTTLGRVRFFEPHQFIVTQGSSRFEVFVIQQGTVLLWDERSAESRLLDVRGAGGMLGIDQFYELRTYPHAARTVSDVLVYAFPAEEFEALIEKYPDARQYVSAYGGVTADYRPRDDHAPHNALLRDLVSTKQPPTCDADVSIADAARLLLNSDSDVLVVVDSEQRIQALLTARSFVQWAAEVGGAVHGPVSMLSSDASAADGVLALAAAGVEALVLTSGTTVTSIITSADIGRVFGDRPQEILRDIRRAAGVAELRLLNQRSRSFVLRYLTNASSSSWLSSFISMVDAAILKRLISMASLDAELEENSVCWCVCGGSGRGESLTGVAPQLVLIVKDESDAERSASAYRRVLDLMSESGYLAETDNSFDVSFYAASLSEWKQRYLDWVADPIFKQIFQALPLFDLRSMFGNQELWLQLETAVMGAINGEFLYIAANDCISTLPPLTFFQNAVVDETGEEASVFRLGETALKPLVDVGRVFGLAGRKVFGSSTLERFSIASRLLPGHEKIFEEAAETLRIFLWQQGRAGLTQGSAGLDLPPSLLGAYDRQVLRNGFHSILQLIEFAGDFQWLKKV